MGKLKPMFFHNYREDLFHPRKLGHEALYCNYKEFIVWTNKLVKDCPFQFYDYGKK